MSTSEWNVKSDEFVFIVTLLCPELSPNSILKQTVGSVRRKSVFYRESAVTLGKP